MSKNNLNDIDAILLRANAYLYLHDIARATRDWKLAYIHNEGEVDHYILRLRKNIYRMLLDATNMNLIDLFASDDKDCNFQELEMLMGFYICTDGNDRKNATAILQVLINCYELPLNSSSPSKEDIFSKLFFLYHMNAHCSKHIIPYDQLHVQKSINSLREYTKFDNHNRELALKSIITLSFETGDHNLFAKMLKEAQQLITSMPSGSDTDRFFEIELKTINFNYLFSKGDYEKAEEEIQQVLVKVEKLYWEMKTCFMRALDSWEDYEEYFEENFCSANPKLHQDWKCVLTLMRACLTNNQDERFREASEQYRNEMQISKGVELDLLSLFRKSLTLSEMSRIYSDFDNELYRYYINNIECFLQISRLCLHVYIAAVHYYMNKGNVIKTAEYMRKAFDLNIPDYGLYICRATLWLKKGRLHDARRYFDLAVKQAHPWLSHTASAYVERAHYFICIYKYDLAEKDLKTAQHIAPGLAIVHIEWGRLYTRMFNKEKAIESFSLAESINDKDVKLYTARAGCCMEFGKYEMAFHDLLVAKSLNPRSFTYLYSASLLLLRCGLCEQARAFARQAEFEDATDCRSHLILAEIALEKDDEQEVELQMRAVFEINPADPRIFVLLSELLLCGKNKLLRRLAALQKISFKLTHFIERILMDEKCVTKHQFTRVRKIFAVARSISPHKSILWRLEAALALRVLQGDALSFYQKKLDKYAEELYFEDLYQTLLEADLIEYGHFDERGWNVIEEMKRNREKSQNKLISLREKCKQQLTL